MPEYLAPGVFVEEVSFRAKSIEGVPTSTTGFVGMTRFGPVHYAGGPTSSGPRLVTSFTEFERVFGPLEDLELDGVRTINLMAHAARAFFLNGGHRLYVARTFRPMSSTNTGVASTTFTVSTSTGQVTTGWNARWPGALGNAVVTVNGKRSKDVSYVDENGTVQARRATQGSIVEVVSADPDPKSAFVDADLRVVVYDQGVQKFFKSDGSLDTSLAGKRIHIVEIDVVTEIGADPRSRLARTASAVTLHPDHPRWIGRIFDRDDPEDEDAAVWFDVEETDFGARQPDDGPKDLIKLFLALVGTTSWSSTVRLQGGNDGLRPDPATVDGIEGRSADLDRVDEPARGLGALAEIDDIAIVAAPDVSGHPDPDQIAMAGDILIAHAEACRYRIAIVDAPENSSMNQVRAFRGRYDSTRAALYHPWIEMFDPTRPATRGGPSPRIKVPPSGFVAGVYARTDVTRGVYKAPANELVYGLTRFEANINTGRNEVLNPEGINALRFLPGRGNRVWGARTMTSDPEWKYVNVRRLFIYLEHSIDKATQWAVFEPNNELLWRRITRTVKDFLEVQWRDGALLGATPDEAFFVRCDRSTMTQNDLDNGRLICLIGVAPTRPAEFVIFRIGQWTAEAKG